MVIENKNTLREFTSLVAVLLVFFSMSPFFIWNNFWLFAIGSGWLLFASLIYFDRVVCRENLILFCFVTMFLLFLTITFREYDSFSFKNPFAIFVLSYILLVSQKSYLWYYNYLRKIFFFISVLSIISWTLFVFNFPFPTIEIKQTFRPQLSDKYYLYYGFCYLNSQVQTFGIFTVIRNIGWFGEPGHFGLYLCMCLMNQRNIFSGKVNKVFVFTIITTLSLSSIFFLIVLALFNSKFHKFIFIILFTFLLLSFLPSEVLDNYLFNKLPTERVLSNRSFLPISLFNTDPYYLIFGYGRDFLNSFNYFSSDVVGYIFKYGVLSIILAIIPILYVVNRLLISGNRIQANALLIFFVFIVSHRSWMIDTLYFWFFVCSFLYTALHKKI